jgi:hypothetical protein
MPKAVGGPARGEMASNVIDSQSGTYDVGPDVQILARKVVAVDPT